MKKIIADLHTHTIVSGHAFGTVRENAQAAAEKGLKILGSTEHGPGIPGTCDPFYFKNLKSAPRNLYGVRILYGSEVNVLDDGSLSLEEDLMDKLDYAIVGIHRYCYKNQGKEKNTENLILCMKHEKVKFVSHPDDDRNPLDYEQLVKAAKEYGVALEVNNSSLLPGNSRIHCRENYREMLKWCQKLQVPVILSSDAHDPLYVGGFDRVEKLLEEEGFAENLVLNTSVQKVWDWIGKEIPDGMITERGF